MDNKEIRKVLLYLADCTSLVEAVQDLPDCNTCGKLKICKYAPKWGEHVRTNCPLWAEDKKRTIKYTVPVETVGDTAIPEKRSKGTWINNMNGTFKCDQCGCEHGRSNFCPNCGARMER